jgi:hypothetical protein
MWKEMYRLRRPAESVDRNSQRLVAAATSATATASAATRKRRPLRRPAITGRRKHRKLKLVLRPSTLRAGNFLLFVDHNLLKLSLAVFADIFVDRHRYPSLYTMSMIAEALKYPHFKDSLEEFHELFEAQLGLVQNAAERSSR